MNQTLETILTHRSIRKYKNQAVEEEKINGILKAAIAGSTMGNMQLYSIIVNQDKAFIKQLAPYHFNQEAVLEAPLMMTFCADFNRFIKWCKQRDAKQGYDNHQSYTWAVIDAVIACQNACIAAESYGLGICYIGTITFNIKPLSKLYNLPKYVVPICTITIGYPNEKPPMTDRLPMEAIVHHEKYQDYSSSDIDRFYFEKEHSEFTKNLLEENKMENLAKIFTEKRYTKKDNEFFAQELIDYLKENNFLPEK